MIDGVDKAEGVMADEAVICVHVQDDLVAAAVGADGDVAVAQRVGAMHVLDYYEIFVLQQPRV